MSWLDAPPPELYRHFETIGNNCEFGIVQRKVGFDPLGLFRNVGFLNVGQIIRAIATNLDGMFEEGNYSYESRPGWSDYALICHQFGFVFHSAVPREVPFGTAEWERHIGRNIAAFSFLKQKLQEDLVSGEKILVYRSKQTVPSPLVRDLHAAIRSRGPCWLLNVMEDPQKPFGWAEMVDDGLLLAAVAQLSNENPPRIDFAAWEAIARRVLAIRFGAPGSPPSWRSPGADTQPTRDVSPPQPGLCVLSHRFERSVSVRQPAFHYLVAGAEAGALYIALAWIYLPREFRGRDVGMAIFGCASERFAKPDLFVREKWQQAWVIARFAGGHAQFVPCLLVEADPGSVIYSAGWDFGRFSSAAQRAPETLLADEKST